MTCNKCGRCCSNYLPLGKNEIKELKQLVRKHKIKPIKRIIDINYYDTCPFLDINNKCIIYEFRPKICKEFACFGNRLENLKKVDTSEIRTLVDIRKEVF